MMRLYVRVHGGIKLFFPIPIGIAKFGCRFVNSSMIRKYIPNESLQYMECIDFAKLEESIDVLKQYKGLRLVDVKCSDGTEVVIIA